MFKIICSRMYSIRQPKWDIMAGICLQRKPVITKSLTDLEVKYLNILQEIELEKSLKSEHELRHDKDVQRMDKLKSGTVTDFDAIDQATNQTAQDYEDKNKEELSSFKFGNCKTEADENDDKKSLKRKLEENLILIIRQKLGPEDVWTLPQGLWNSEETLKETAERTLKGSFDDIKVRFYGNAPCGFYKYKYPKEKREQSNVEGAKIFFFKATLINGSTEKKSKWAEYEWATVQELKNRLNQPYMKNVKLFLSNYNV